MTPRQRSELYRVGVGAAAVATFAATAPRLGGERPDWWLVAALAVAGILALEFPLHVNISEKVSVATAVFFAAVLLLPLWQAAALVGVLQALDICIAALRKVRATKERPPLRAVASSIVFNGGQAYLSTLAAAFVLSIAGVSAKAGLTGPADAVVLAGSAVTMYVANLLFVAVAIALGTSRSPIPLFLNTQKLVYVQFTTLYLVGTAAAFAAVRYTWLPLLAIMPAVLAPMILLGLAAAQNAPEPSIQGQWRSPGGNSIIAIAPCGSSSPTRSLGTATITASASSVRPSSTTPVTAPASDCTPRALAPRRTVAPDASSARRPASPCSSPRETSGSPMSAASLRSSRPVRNTFAARARLASLAGRFSEGSPKRSHR